MQKIFQFLIRHKNTILFLLLFGLSLFFTIQSHSYHRSKFISSANAVTGGAYSWTSNIDDYLNLKSYNKRLLEENKRLRTRLTQFSTKKADSAYLDTTSFDTPYQFIPARIIANRYSRKDNYILINRGKKDSLKEDMGVITSDGIIGVVEKSSANFSRVISILNSNLLISAQFKKSNHYGTLNWEGGNPNIIQLTEVPRLANVKKGDTIITDGRSFIFPKGVPVGIVHDFELDRDQNYYKVNVQLFNDMTNIGYCYVIKNNNGDELKSLRKKNE